MERVALVTGAAAGIGAASAMRLASNGYTVGVLDLELGKSQATVEQIVERGGKALALAADVSDPEQIGRATAELRRAAGPISTLVNNAAITSFSPFLETRLDDWERVHRVNLTGTFLVTQHVLPDLVAGGWGRIINITASAAQTGAKFMAAYSSSKGGMISLTRTLAVEFGPCGITANVISPRFITGTIMSENSFAESRQPMNREALAQLGPICREGRPEDVAAAVGWLASEEAGYVTGQIIGVNGGRIIQ